MGLHAANGFQNEESPSRGEDYARKRSFMPVGAQGGQRGLRLVERRYRFGNEHASPHGRHGFGE